MLACKSTCWWSGSIIWDWNSRVKARWSHRGRGRPYRMRCVYHAAHGVCAMARRQDGNCFTWLPFSGQCECSEPPAGTPRSSRHLIRRRSVLVVMHAWQSSQWSARVCHDSVTVVSMNIIIASQYRDNRPASVNLLSKVSMPSSVTSLPPWPRREQKLRLALLRLCHTRVYINCLRFYVI